MEPLNANSIAKSEMAVSPISAAMSILTAQPSASSVLASMLCKFPSTQSIHQADQTKYGLVRICAGLGAYSCRWV